MSRSTIAALTAVVAVGLLAPLPVSAQEEGDRAADGTADWTLPRTPDGQPDLPAIAAKEIRSPNSGRSPDSHGPTSSSTLSRRDASPSISERRSVWTQASAGM